MPDLLTVKQFAAYMQAHDNTVRNWIESGLIPVYHVNRFIRIDREAALEALRNYNPRRSKKRIVVSTPVAEKEPVPA